MDRGRHENVTSSRTGGDPRARRARRGPPAGRAARQGLVAKGVKLGYGHDLYIEEAFGGYDGGAAHRLGLRAGAFWTFWTAGGRLSLQPELLVAYNRYAVDLAAITVWDDATGREQPVGQGTASASRFELSVPLLLKWNVGRGGGALVSVYLGPTAGIGLFAAADRSELGWDADLGGTELGGLTGISFGVERYVIDLRATVVGTKTDIRWLDASSTTPGGVNPALELSATFGVLW